MIDLMASINQSKIKFDIVVSLLNTSFKWLDEKSRFGHCVDFLGTGTKYF